MKRNPKENGKSKFNGDEMFKIADYFKLNITDIFLPSYHQNGEISASIEEKKEN